MNPVNKEISELSYNELHKALEDAEKVLDALQNVVEDPIYKVVEDSLAEITENRIFTASLLLGFDKEKATKTVDTIKKIVSVLKNLNYTTLIKIVAKLQRRHVLLWFIATAIIRDENPNEE